MPDRGIPTAAGGAWQVLLHRRVAKQISGYGPRDFRPALAELNGELRRDPKQFPKKSGALREFRAVSLRYRGTTSWRLVFRIDERRREVQIVSLGPHDEAYEVAARRSRMRSAT
jgi:mRNA-degrading endonuclease RelE of RelBE toxin-antitoxin system